MIHPRPHDVLTFLWRHLEEDLRVLGRALDQNVDDAAVTVHLILDTCAQSPGRRLPRARLPPSCECYC